MRLEKAKETCGPRRFDWPQRMPAWLFGDKRFMLTFMRMGYTRQEAERQKELQQRQEFREGRGKLMRMKLHDILAAPLPPAGGAVPPHHHSRHYPPEDGTLHHRRHS
jgi:hypothetical protein